jgi:hypothetical protein
VEPVTLEIPQWFCYSRARQFLRLILANCAMFVLSGAILAMKLKWGDLTH